MSDAEITERAARDVMGWRQGEGELAYGWQMWEASQKRFVWAGYLAHPVEPKMLVDDDGHESLNFRIIYAGKGGVFDPLNKWEHAGLLVEKMRGKKAEIQSAFDLSITDAYEQHVLNRGNPKEGIYPFTWLNPHAITIAAVEAIQKAVSHEQ